VLAQRFTFTPEASAEILSGVPAARGVFALEFGAGTEPYIAKAADLRRRLTRLLSPPENQSKRLNLRDRVRSVAFSVTGSEFESMLLLYRASAEAFGPRAQQRLRLSAPMCLRLTVENAYPRVYVSNRIAQKDLGYTFGPFQSRNAAERYLDAALDLFKMRRCHEELHPHPSHPGCVYSEMKKCLAPCFKGCTDERYAQEAQAVEAFLATRGDSLLEALGKKRDEASAALEFEQAAELHQQIERVKAAAALCPEIVHRLSELDALLVMPAADDAAVSIFTVRAGVLHGPVPFSVAGMRHPNEQSGSSSLFAHPAMIEAVPLEPEAAVTTVTATRNELEERLLGAVAAGEGQPRRVSAADRAAHLALLKRWYYRTAARRIGEIFFSNEDGSWPVQRVLRGVSRVFVTGRDLVPATASVWHPPTPKRH
jgi:excinuclease ABC subunit C